MSIKIKKVFGVVLFCIMPFVGNAAVDLRELADRICALTSNDPQWSRLLQPENVSHLFQYAGQMQSDDLAIQSEAVRMTGSILYKTYHDLVKELNNSSNVVPRVNALGSPRVKQMLEDSLTLARDALLQEVQSKIPTRDLNAASIQLLSDRVVNIANDPQWSRLLQPENVSHLFQYAGQMQSDDLAIQSEAVKMVRTTIVNSQIRNRQVLDFIKDLDDIYIALLSEDTQNPETAYALRSPMKVKKTSRGLVLRPGSRINAGFVGQILQDQPQIVCQCKAAEYFGNCFTNLQKISFGEKKGGDQLGNIMIITLDTGKSVKYHIKTHRNGLRSTHSSGAKPVDIRELFVYKFLEHSGLGAEAHFFWDNLNDFYIATQDASSGTSTKFHTYAQIRENQTLCNVADYKSKILDQNQVNPFVIQVLVMADIVGRIFGLSDLVTNDGNIGLICDENKIVGYKIIDFDFGNLSNPDSVFEGFKNGNDIRHYLGMQDQIIHYFLASRPLEERIDEAKKLFNPELFLQSIETARGQVFNMGISLSEQNMEALNAYIENIKANVGAFARGLSIALF